MSIKIKFKDTKGYSIKGLTQEQVELIIALVSSVGDTHGGGQNQYEYAADTLHTGLAIYSHLVDGSPVKIVHMPGVIYVRPN